MVICQPEVEGCEAVLEVLFQVRVLVSAAQTLFQVEFVVFVVFGDELLGSLVSLDQVVFIRLV